MAAQVQSPQGPSISSVQEANADLIAFQTAMMEQNVIVSKAMAALQAVMNAASKVSGR